MLKDNASIKGIVNLVLRDEHGRVKQHKTIRNAVTKDGIAHIIGRLMDTGQDRNGISSKKHTMPRMMSHMAIGVGESAQATAANTSTVVGATTLNRFLQGEVGKRVQVMKDTSRAADYVQYPITIDAAQQTDNASANYYNVTVGDTFFLLATSASTTGTLRVGMALSAAQWLPAATFVKSITNQDNGVSKIELMDAQVEGNAQAILGGPNSVASGTQADVTFTMQASYVGVIGSLDLGNQSHPYAATGSYGGAASATVAYSFDDYSTGLRGKIGGYYDTVNTPADIAANSKLAPFFGEAAEAPQDFNQFGTDLDGMFQGSRPAGSGSIVEDVGTSAEGYHPEEHDFGGGIDLATLNYTGSGAANAKRGSKKVGNRIVFIATFKEQNPNNSNTLVREAGIFNAIVPHPSYDTTGFSQTTGGVTVAHPAIIDNAGSISDNAYNLNSTVAGGQIDAAGGGTVKSFAQGSPRSGIIEQTMLCRTTFDVVTKAELDTLQITWSVQLADQ